MTKRIVSRLTSNNTELKVVPKGLVPYDYKGADVRTLIDINGKVWFVATDVAKVLIYKNPNKAVQDHCRKVVSLDSLYNDSLYDEKLTLRSTTLMIPESDIYALTMRSKLPSAIKFQDWVFEEVLPSIRKTGSYSAIQEAPLPTILDPQLAAIQAMLIQLDAVKQEQARQAAEQERQDSIQKKHTKSIRAQKRKSLELEAKVEALGCDYHHYTILGFANLHNIKMPVKEAARLGKLATSMSSLIGANIELVKDTRFGVINSYRDDVLTELFEVEDLI
jgi:prophage antirepressor-like protein